MAWEPTVLSEFSVSQRLHGSTRPLEHLSHGTGVPTSPTENNPAAECGLNRPRSSVCKETVPTLTVADVLENPWRLDAPPVSTRLPELAHVSHPPTFLRRTAMLSQALSLVYLSWHLFPQLLTSLTFCNGCFALLYFSKQHSLDRIFPLNVLLCTNYCVLNSHPNVIFICADTSHHMLNCSLTLTSILVLNPHFIPSSPQGRALRNLVWTEEPSCYLWATSAM